MWTRIYAAGGWYTGDTLGCTQATHKGVTIQFGGGPHPEDWYGTLDAISEGRLDPLPSVGMIIGLDEVPEALGLAREAQGPPRIVVHPNG
jgi:threonine dehydrogenase-like Zn-dependent dehydrogenase